LKRFTDNDRSVLVRQDALDMEADVLNQTARVANEGGGGAAP
jgi:hypothetical protein